MDKRWPCKHSFSNSRLISIFITDIVSDWLISMSLLSWLVDIHVSLKLIGWYSCLSYADWLIFMSLLSWLVDIHVSPKLQLYTNSLSICELCSLYCSLLDTKDNCCSHHLLNTDILVMRNQLIHNCLTLHHSCACPKRAPGFSKTYVMVYLCVQWFKVIVLLVLMELLTITLFKLSFHNTVRCQRFSS